MRTASYLYFSYERFREMKQPQKQKKVRRSQDDNPIGINTVENTLAVCCSCGFLKMCANFQWKLNVHIKKKKNPNL